LQQLGWIEGRNLRIDIRWAAGDAELYRKFAAELVALAPDIILASSSPTVAALQAATRTVPIVFAHAVDPVGAGFVDSLARPGGNATGFVLFEYGISAKWLELLKEIAPALKRVAVLRDPTTAAGMGQFGAIQSVAPSFGMEVNPVSLRDPGEIERGVTAFAASPNGGLIITAAPLGTLYRELIIGELPTRSALNEAIALVHRGVVSIRQRHLERACRHFAAFRARSDSVCVRDGLAGWGGGIRTSAFQNRKH
jgi:putative ABC transport system substrate-binding protein